LSSATYNRAQIIYTQIIESTPHKNIITYKWGNDARFSTGAPNTCCNPSSFLLVQHEGHLQWAKGQNNSPAL